jgi:hypothetical protein
MEEEEPQSTKIKWWAAALAIFGVLLWMPSWSLVLVFFISAWLAFFPGDFEDKGDDFSLGLKALGWGAILLIGEAFLWWLIGNKELVPLRNALIPTKNMPLDYRLALFGWGTIFFGALLLCRGIFHAARGDSS